MVIESQILLFFLAILVSFVVTFVAIPSIIKVANIKNLFDDPEDDRKVHTTKIPTLGGVAIFAGISISLLFFIDINAFPALKYLIISLVILFFIGIKDDILMIAPYTKMLGQIVASFIIVFFGKIQITNLHGFFNIFEINQFVGVPLSIFTVLVIINAINFIDGIDGLSATLSIIISLTFGTWFYLVGEEQFVIISLAIIGALIAFLRFNLSNSSTKKIFMGDTGSLIMGLLISVLVIAFNEKNIGLDSKYFILPAPSVSFVILIIPLFDMLRVMFTRILQRKHVLYPDKNHIHHAFLKLGFSHKQIVLIIVAINIGFIILSFWLSNFLTIRRLLLIQLLMVSTFNYILNAILRKKLKKKK